ncbi:MAG: putative porin [Verrucomicrobiota bacterium]
MTLAVHVKSFAAKLFRAYARFLVLSLLLLLSLPCRGQGSDRLLDLLQKKGILSDKEAADLKAEAAQTNAANASKWKLNSAIKDITLFGDLRFRYESRGVGTVGGQEGARERFRYAVRLGLRGDLFDDFYYGIRLETSQNPRSPWVTFGDENSFPFPGPSAKSNDSIQIGQAFLGWRAAEWLELTVGKMPNPLYTTPMLWDSDINPEGAAEKLKYSWGRVDFFATFGQFLYTDANPDNPIDPFFGASSGNRSDAFLLAWQLGAQIKFNQDLAFKIAPVLYNYTGQGQNGGFPGPFVGEGLGNGSNYALDPATGRYGVNSSNPFYSNQSGINNLLVLEVPAEFNFKLGPYRARLFGDLALNLEGDARARAAAGAPGSRLAHAYPNENMAYQIGFGVGNLGLVYGQTSKKNSWEARAYWQHTEQYAVDVNLIDSDFLEGRANLEGIFAALAYSLSDNIIATVRYGYGQRINQHLGTGGSNQDIPQVNPVKSYNLVQLDLAWRF